MKSLLKNIKTLGKTGIALYLFLAVGIFGSIVVYATVTVVSGGYRISASSSSNLITSDSQHCSTINNNIPYDIFVPTNSLIERNTFKSSHPSSIVVSNYTPPAPTCAGNGVCVNGTFTSGSPTCEGGSLIIRGYCYGLCGTVSSQCAGFIIGSC